MPHTLLNRTRSLEGNEINSLTDLLDDDDDDVVQIRLFMALIRASDSIACSNKPDCVVLCFGAIPFGAR